MNRIACLVPLICAALCTHTFVPSARAATITFGSGDNQFNMEFVTIGNPGNSDDTTGDPSPAGAVPYIYNMGKFEVSRDMITKANNLGGLGITLEDMTLYGGNGANQPATGVSWDEAARFVNWLNISQGYSPAYKFFKQPGQIGYDPNADILLWSIDDEGFNALNPYRNSQAHYFLPSADEWYKAAYYDPNHGGPGVGGYWDFPTGSDSSPTPVASGTATGTAVYGAQAAPAEISSAGGLSPYGVMALGGNVWEWEETEYHLLRTAL